MAGLFENLTSGRTGQYSDYQTALNNAINQQKKAVGQYTGNAGYQNAINQGLQGAAVTANQAGAQAQQAARNAGMSKAQAAALGSSNAANAYGQNFANQQAQAANMGQNAVAGTSSLANTNLGAMASENATKAAEYGRANQNLQTIGNIAAGVGGLFTALSDERMKDIQNRATNLSKMIEGIDAYKYEYKPEAQKEYGVDSNEHVGVMAQDLAKNPVTAHTVNENENGDLTVDTKQLTMTNLALIADLARRLDAVEEKR